MPGVDFDPNDVMIELKNLKKSLKGANFDSTSKQVKEIMLDLKGFPSIRLNQMVMLIGSLLL